jgi:hypothetical protein
MKRTAFKLIPLVCFSASLCLGLASCSDSLEESEAFPVTASLLSADVGKPCDLGTEPMGNEVIVEEHQNCGEGVCLGVGPDRNNGSAIAECSCRCDTTIEGSGPLCPCPSTHECRHLVEDLGFSNQYAGSYCVPR